MEARLSRRLAHILDRISPLHIGLLGLALTVPIALYTYRLIVTGLSVTNSLILLAFAIGSGYAYIGWQWNVSQEMGKRLGRMLLGLAGTWLLLVVVRLTDQALLSFMTAGGETVVYAIPGVYIEASGGARYMSIDNVPPYGLLMTVYAMITAWVGNRMNSFFGRRATRGA
jgi:CDP-diglyceride synthetase